MLILIANLSGSCRCLSLPMVYWMWLFRATCEFSTPCSYRGRIYFCVCWKILLSTRKYAVDDRLTWTDRMFRKSKILNHWRWSHWFVYQYVCNNRAYRIAGFVKLNRILAVFVMDPTLINPCLKMGVLMYNKITWRETHV